jgi:hypothetical protein
VLVLTPEVYADGEKLTKAVNEHRRVGPVVVIAPKWQTMPVDTRQPGLRRGWVRVIGTELPQWKGFLDDVTVNTRGFGTGARRVATSLSVPAPVLPDAMVVEVGGGARLRPFARAQGQVLAARYDETIPSPPMTRMRASRRPSIRCFWSSSPICSTITACRMGTMRSGRRSSSAASASLRGGSPSTSPSTVWAASPIC